MINASHVVVLVVSVSAIVVTITSRCAVVEVVVCIVIVYTDYPSAVDYMYRSEEILDALVADPLRWSEYIQDLLITHLISKDIVVIYACERAEIVVVDLVDIFDLISVEVELPSHFVCEEACFTA